MQTEISFTLPRGYVDERGNLHRAGTMRLATARDEIEPLREVDVRQNHAYLTVLRCAFARAGEGPELQLYFGATSGDVFGSGDAGASWFTAARNLPPVYSVQTA